MKLHWNWSLWFCLQLGLVALAGPPRPVAGPELVFEELDGLVAVEAEHFHRQSLDAVRAWHLTAPERIPVVEPDGDLPHLEDASGGAYVELLPDTRRTHGDPLVPGENFSSEPGRMAVLHYKVWFNNPGRYYVWVRAFSTGTEDNGLHVGLNGRWPESGRRMQWCDGKDSWRWESRQRTESEHCGVPHAIYLDIPNAGEHEVQFSMREDGFEFDKFLLTNRREFPRPLDAGPASRIRHGVLPDLTAAASEDPAPEPPRPGGIARPFPGHWGPPPRIQTMDYRPLPGGYGFGSSTLAAWIRRNMEQDVVEGAGAGVRVTGEPRQWHTVTLTFDGPESDETATPNPFLDHRLDVTFTHAASGESRIVPGFFAADGAAAETSATSGNQWRVHFSPNRTGEWRWRVSFRTGTDVAVADSREAGEPWAPLDGHHGSVRIGPGDAVAPDLRSRGHLEYVGERYLRFAGDGTRYLKGGVDSPETLLGYADFDGTYRDLSRTNRPPSPNPIIGLPALQDGLLRFESHVQDWREGDPTWKDGRGRGLIGGLNYLSSQGVNSVYFLTMNVNGDGRNVWPWVDPWIRDRFDCSKLDQWDLVFHHMTRLGIQLHLVTQETENDHLLDRGHLGRERKLYYRELVARFAHHPAVTWNLGEENVQSVDQQRACLAWLRDLLPYRQHLVVHNDHWHAKNLRETFDPLLGGTIVDAGGFRDRPAVDWPGGRVPLLTGTALQDFHWPDVHPHVRHYVQASAAAGVPWVVTADELGGANFGTLPDAVDPDHDDPRRFGLWGTLMAGGAGVEWYFGWQNNSPTSDLSCEDWRTREGMYRQTRIALGFFHEHLPFWRMVPADEVVTGHGVSALLAPGELLAIYLPNGGGTRFDLGAMPGRYEVKWFNPREGGALRDGEVRTVRGPGLAWTGFPPEHPSKDWLALVRRVPEMAPSAMEFPGTAWREMSPADVGVHPNGLHHALNYWRMHTGTNGVDEVVLVRRGVVFHKGTAADRVHNVWSVTKSVTSTALGLLTGDGVTSLDAKAGGVEPLLDLLYPRVTLRDFATMTSGYDAVGRSRWGADSADWSATPYEPAPPLFPPRTKFAYWDEAQMMFGRVLTRLANRDLFELLRERLFDPIGMRVADWTPEGEVVGLVIRNGCTGLQVDALNLARLGHLFLNEGRWSGRQVVPSAWVREATRVQVPVQLPVADTARHQIEGPGAYGYNWWVNGRGPDERLSCRMPRPAPIMPRVSTTTSAWSFRNGRWSWCAWGPTVIPPGAMRPSSTPSSAAWAWR